MDAGVWYLIAFFVETWFLYRLEKRMWGMVFTPLNMLMLPFTLATIVAIVYPYIDGHIPHYYLPSLVVWMAGLLLFEIPSCWVASRCKGLSSSHQCDISIGLKDDFYPYLKYIAYGCILLSLLKLRSMSNQLDDYGTDDFSEQYQSAGIFAHLSVLLGAIFSFAIYKANRAHKSAFIIIAGALIGMYAVGTKSWIIAPVLMGYYARVMSGKTKLTYKTALLPVLVIMGIFFLSYYLILVMAGGNAASADFFIFIGNHFVDYFSGASLTLSLDYKMGFIEPEMTESLFGPLLNLVNVIKGEPYVKVINPIFINIGTLGENNVRTFFGTIIAYSKSPLVFVVLSLTYSFLIYVMYAWSRHSNSIFLLLATCSNMVFLTFGFFEYYWLNLSCYEIFAIFILMHYFLDRIPRSIIKFNQQNSNNTCVE